MAEEIKELPQPDISVESFSRSELAAVLSLLLTKNLTYEQAAALAVVSHYSPSLARALTKEFKKVLHPRFTEIIESLRPPAPQAPKGDKDK